MRNRVRTESLKNRDEIPYKQRNEKSIKIHRRAACFKELEQSDSFFIYVDFRSEVETIDLINRYLEMNKRVSVPLTLVADKKLLAVQIKDTNKHLIPGYCGIPEPTAERVTTSNTDPGTIDAVIIPGSVFDERGGRLGYGGGYYDRFLVEKAPQAIRVALAFESQIVPLIEMEEHDQYMDVILTENRIIDCRGKRNA